MQPAAPDEVECGSLVNAYAVSRFVTAYPIDWIVLVTIAKFMADPVPYL